MFSAVHFSVGRPCLAAVFILLAISCHLEGAKAENISCKNKVRNRWLEFCIKDGVTGRVGRDVGSVSVLSRLKRQMPAEYGIRSPGDPAGRFPPPMTGDDLGMGMTIDDVEDIYEEMIERLPRAPKDNKDQVIKMLTDFAAKCCNENLQDATCTDPGNVITCP